MLIDFLIEDTVRVAILGNGPVDGLRLLLRCGHRSTIGYFLFGEKACSDHQIAVRSYFIEELEVFPGRVGASSIAPNEEWQRIGRTEAAKVGGEKEGVSLEALHLLHHSLVRSCSTLFDDFVLCHFVTWGRLAAPGNCIQ